MTASQQVFSFRFSGFYQQFEVFGFQFSVNTQTWMSQDIGNKAESGHRWRAAWMGVAIVTITLARWVAYGPLKVRCREA
jgi:hypothetical protein